MGGSRRGGGLDMVRIKGMMGSRLAGGGGGGGLWMAKI